MNQADDIQVDSLQERIRQVFLATGPLARALPKFYPRAEQPRMACAIAEAFTLRETLVVEAGTGVGKTYAYLVPALLDGGKVIISTGTRNLQDQLFRKDLPLVEAALHRNVRCTLLKGRANYLCRYRLKEQIHQSAGRRGQDWSKLKKIECWAGQTMDGDIAGLAEIPEDHPIWPKVTSTAENCLGQECPEFSKCDVLKARRKAQEADIVVINHHLFFADLALKEEGFGQILPSANAFILDEAHQLPEIASVFFGLRLSSRQLHELGRDAFSALLTEAPDQPDLHGLPSLLEQAAAEVRLAMGSRTGRLAWFDLPRQDLDASLRMLKAALDTLHGSFAAIQERGKALEGIARRSAVLGEHLQKIMQPADETVRWCDVQPHGFALHLTPMQIAETFTAHRTRYPAAWIFTSATLAIGEDFDHFCQVMGLGSPRTLQLGSPFDFRTQALIYQPRGLPSPNAENYTEAWIDALRPLLETNPGGTFLLFTSHRALQIAARRLDGCLDRPLLVQGTASRHDLLERFRATGNAILLGAQSFWEGVDVRGSALSCVVMDRLPFAAPDDPLFKARSEALRAQGRNPFMEYQLPRAIIAFKQGVGRLIRDVSDRGVLVLCDPRIKETRYGPIFRRCLPPAPVTDELHQVLKFMRVGKKRKRAKPRKK